MNRLIPALLSACLILPSAAHAQDDYEGALAGITEIAIAAKCGFMPTEAALTIVQGLGGMIIQAEPKKEAARKVVGNAISIGIHDAGIQNVCRDYGNSPIFRNDINNALQDQGLPPAFPAQ
jgi:hypothetical protein